jgi:hypothetical protein
VRVCDIYIFSWALGGEKVGGLVRVTGIFFPLQSLPTSLLVLFTTDTNLLSVWAFFEELLLLFFGGIIFGYRPKG